MRMRNIEGKDRNFQKRPKEDFGLSLIELGCAFGGHTITGLIAVSLAGIYILIYLLCVSFYPM